MHDKNNALKEILLLELKDVADDLNSLILICDERHEKGEISNYVCSENKAFLQNEIQGIRGFVSDLKKVDTTKYNTTDEMITALKVTLRSRIKTQGIAPALFELIERKIEKVVNYIA